MLGDTRERERHRLTLVVDPRFPGGTAAAVAEEIRALRGHVDLRVCAIATAMFEGRSVNPRLAAALDEAGIGLEWNPAVIRGDTVVVHNPSSLRFDRSFGPRISCTRLFAVTHENFLRPNGSEAFDVSGCLHLIAGAVAAGETILAPVSPVNRRGVEAWLSGAQAPWTVAEFDWFNIWSGPMQSPSPAPRDRRGRHSRPGLEKFPPMASLRAQFPPHAERCIVLGADLLLREGTAPRHWTALPFGATDVDRFLSEIDFFVYFTHPLWQESFGRAVAEAVAAGKLVITDPVTAATFGPGVVASDGHDVDAVVARFLSDPAAYCSSVRRAQAGLARWSPLAFRDAVLPRLGAVAERVRPRVRRRDGARRAHAGL